jgi:hypothetical protein
MREIGDELFVSRHMVKFLSFRQPAPTLARRARAGHLVQAGITSA